MAKRRAKAKTPTSGTRKFQRLYVLEWLEMLDQSQAKVAETAGISEGYLSLLANGKKQFTQTTLEKLAKAMGLDNAGLLFYPPVDRPVWDKYQRLGPAERRQFFRLLDAIPEPN